MLYSMPNMVVLVTEKHEGLCSFYNYKRFTSKLFTVHTG